MLREGWIGRIGQEEKRIQNKECCSRSGSGLLLFLHSVFLILYSSSLAVRSRFCVTSVAQFTAGPSLGHSTVMLSTLTTMVPFALIVTFIR
jgi:hypothetical protein